MTIEYSSSPVIDMATSADLELVTPLDDARPFVAALRVTGQAALLMAEISVYIAALAFLHGELPTLREVVLVFFAASVVLSCLVCGVGYLVHRRTRGQLFPRRIRYDPLTDMVTVATPDYVHEFVLTGSSWTTGSTLQETHGEFLPRSEAILLKIGEQENGLPYIMSLPASPNASLWRELLEQRGVCNLRPYRRGKSVMLPPPLAHAMAFGGFVGLLIAWAGCKSWSMFIGPPQRPEIVYGLLLLMAMSAGIVVGVREDAVDSRPLLTLLGFSALFLAFGIPLAIREDDVAGKMVVLSAFTAAPLLCSVLDFVWRRRWRRWQR